MGDFQSISDCGKEAGDGMMPPVVTVLLPVYQTEWNYLSAAIESILQQTLKDIELLIVEAPSALSAEKRIAEIADHRIRYVPFGGKAHLIDQLNFGLEQARTEYIARMDADDWSSPERLEVQWKYLESHERVAVVGSQIDVMDSEGHVIGSRRYPTEPLEVAKTLRRYNPLAHPSVMFRRNVVLEAGGYQPFEANEDYELWCRLDQLGHYLANVPETLLRYRLHGAAVKSTKLKTLLAGTRAVKRRYFGHRMNLGDRARYWAERLLLFLPASWIMWLFRRLQIRRESRR